MKLGWVLSMAAGQKCPAHPRTFATALTGGSATSVGWFVDSKWNIDSTSPA